MRSAAASYFELTFVQLVLCSRVLARRCNIRLLSRHLVSVRLTMIPASPPDARLTPSVPSETEVAAAVARARTGAPQGIATLYEWFAEDLLRLTTRLLASRADAEDVVHDLFVGLPEYLARYGAQGRLRAWLRVTAIGLARMRSRRERRRADVLFRIGVGELAGRKVTDPALAIDLENAIAALPDALRMVFVLKQWEGYSHDEIAVLLQITVSASRVRHARALQHLRNRLDP